MEEFLYCWYVEIDQVQNWAKALWWSGRGWFPGVQLWLEPWDGQSKNLGVKDGAGKGKEVKQEFAQAVFR